MTCAKELSDFIKSNNSYPFIVYLSLKNKNDLYLAIYKKLDYTYNYYYEIKINSSIYDADELLKGIYEACSHSIYWENLSNKKEVVKFLTELKENIYFPLSKRIWNWILNLIRK